MWNLVGYLTPMAVALVAVPVLLEYLGAQRLGILLMAWAVLGYMMLCNLGLNRSLTKALAEGVTADLPAKLATCRLALLLLGVGSGLLLAAAAYPIAHGWLKLPIELRGETEWLFYMLALSLPVLMLTKHHRGILEGLGRFDLANRVQLCTSTMNYLGPVLMLPFSRSLACMGAIILANRVLGWWVLSLFSRHQLPALAEPARASWSEFKQLLGPGIWMALSALVLPLLAVLDRLFIGRWCSAEASAYYATPYEMVTKLWLVSQSMLLVMFPYFASAHARQPQDLPQLYGRTQRVLLAVMFPCVCVFLLLADELLLLWVGAEFAAEGAGVMRCLAVGMLFQSLSATSLTFLQSTGHARFPAQVSLLTVLAYLPCAMLAAYFQGIVGIALVWSLRHAVESLLFFRSILSQFPDTRHALGLRYLRNWLLPTGCCAYCWFLGWWSASTGEILIGGGVLWLGLVCWLYNVWLKPDDRLWLVGKFS